jgi:hypothetical protein
VLVVDVLVLLQEVAEDDALQPVALALVEELAHLGQGIVAGLDVRVREDAGADGREGNALEVVLHGQLQAPAIAALELVLGVLAAERVPARTHRVYDLVRRQVVALGHLGVARLAAAQPAALVDQVGACCAVDGAVDTAAAQQRLVGGVDDGVDGEGGDVLLDDRDFVVVRGVRPVRRRVVFVERNAGELVQQTERGDLVELHGGHATVGACAGA